MPTKITFSVILTNTKEERRKIKKFFKFGEKNLTILTTEMACFTKIKLVPLTNIFEKEIFRGLKILTLILLLKKDLYCLLLRKILT
jgi:hypothetical protein